MGVQLSTGGDKKVKPNINVTPLVDVVLVLLIIFMLVIPNMQEGVPIELFKAANAEKDEEDAEPITVSVARAKGSDAVSYHLGDQVLTGDTVFVFGCGRCDLRGGDPEQMIVTRWSQDPETFGAYSYTAKGIFSDDYDDLREPVEDVVFLAGEHTYFDFHGTTHGAYMTGLMAAEEILDLV